MKRPDRFPTIASSELSPLQQQYTDELLAGPRGAVTGPFIPLMHAPELARRVEKLGEYLRFNSSLPADITELVILIVARHWTCHYEWHFHARLARLAGVSDASISEIQQGSEPRSLTPVHEAVHAFCTEIMRDKRVSDMAFDGVEQFLGKHGALDLLGLCGYYSMLAMMLNTAQLMPEEGKAF